MQKEDDKLWTAHPRTYKKPFIIKGYGDQLELMALYARGREQDGEYTDCRLIRHSDHVVAIAYAEAIENIGEKHTVDSSELQIGLTHLNETKAAIKNNLLSLTDLLGIPDPQHDLTYVDNYFPSIEDFVEVLDEEAYLFCRRAVGFQADPETSKFQIIDIGNLYRSIKNQYGGPN